METVISPKRDRKKETMTDTKRILLLSGAVEVAKERLLNLNKYEASTETIKYLNDILKLIY